MSTATRVLAVGAVATTGLFATLAAGFLPGRNKVAGSLGRAPAATSASSVGAGSNVGTGSGDDSNLAPPPAVPDPSYQYSAPVVVSGAS